MEKALFAPWLRPLVVGNGYLGLVIDSRVMNAGVPSAYIAYWDSGVNVTPVHVDHIDSYASTSSSGT